MVYGLGIWVPSFIPKSKLWNSVQLLKRVWLMSVKTEEKLKHFWKKTVILEWKSENCVYISP